MRWIGHVGCVRGTGRVLSEVCGLIVIGSDGLWERIELLLPKRERGFRYPTGVVA